MDPLRPATATARYGRRLVSGPVYGPVSPCTVHGRAMMVTRQISWPPPKRLIVGSILGAERPYRGAKCPVLLGSLVRASGLWRERWETPFSGRSVRQGWGQPQSTPTHTLMAVAFTLMADASVSGHQRPVGLRALHWWLHGIEFIKPGLQFLDLLIYLLIELPGVDIALEAVRFSDQKTLVGKAYKPEVCSSPCQ